MTDQPELLGDILQRLPYLKPQVDQYVILLGDMPGQSVPAIVRLRSALKSLRRAYNLKCIGIADASGEVAHE